MGERAGVAERVGEGGKSGASLDPQTTMSASSARRIRSASPRDWAPDAQAVPIDEV